MNFVDSKTSKDMCDPPAMISALTVGALGNVRGQTMNGFSADEMKGFISKMP